MINTFRVALMIPVLLSPGPHAFAQVHGEGDVHLEWARQYISGFAPAFDAPYAIAVDASGNAHVTGGSYGPDQLPDIATLKYNSAGDTLWIRRYNGPGDSWDDGRAVAIDSLGHVYVTGWTYSGEHYFDYVTIKYDASGAQQWVAHYNGSADSDDRAVDIAVDASGNVYVTGTSYGVGTADDYVTIKYNSLGEEQWVARYNGPGNTQDRVAALALDAQGNVYVTGSSGEGSENLSDYVTVKYNAAGVQQWFARYSELYDYATAIGVDGSANVYVTGYSYQLGTYYDYATVKYNTMGVQQWVSRYNGPGTSDDLAYGLMVDQLGNVLVTGEAFFEPETGTDYATIKYSPSGVQQWVGRYNGPGNAVDVAFALALDDWGNVYVTGGSRGSDLVDDFATIKYSASGVEEWSVRHSAEGDTFNIASAIGVDPTGGVYVTGSSTRLGGRLYTTVKYAQGLPTTVENDWRPREGDALNQGGPNPFRQRALMRYSLGATGHIRLKVFNVRGEEVATLVDGVRGAGDGIVEWDAEEKPSGVYFFRLEAGGSVETKRVVLLR
jgi:hypothetical protein